MKNYIILIGLLATGCTSIEKSGTEYKYDNTKGVTNVIEKIESNWKYTSVFNRKSIQKLRVSKDGSITADGYLSTQAENLRAVSEGITEGLIKGGAKAIVPIP